LAQVLLTYRFSLAAHSIAAMLKLVALLVAAASGTELDSTSWDAAVAGKTVFIKFQAPW